MAYCVKMLWMETFCFYCSVRLGIIVTAIFSLFQAFISTLLLATYGSSIFKSAKHFFEQEDQHNQDPLIQQIINDLSERTQGYVILFDIVLVSHMLACISVVYGAVKLRKNFLIPYMVSQFLLFAGSLTEHIIAMIILKRVVNLGVLIGITLAGGFYILFLGYSWAAAVALFQIIILITSQRYKNLYGEDPMAPRARNDLVLGHGTIENVKIFMTPNHNEISAIKRKRLIEEQQEYRFERNIVSVMPIHPVDKKDDDGVINFNNWHWNELVGVRQGYK